MTNVDIITQAYADFAEGNIPAVLAVFADDIQWTEAAGFIYGGTYVGADAIVQGVFVRMGTEWDSFQVKPEMVIGEGGNVSAIGWYEGAYHETGRDFTARFAHWWRLADGKIASFEQVVDSVKTNEATLAR
ncbi:MAG: nuclear transport factor 2 family protein [Propionibacteriaceae bacterium]